ncbi:MAG: hypothetical protein JWQ01_4892 [Massilia sp.]|nr:hypothetical protein [Massilia sp.]
MGGAVQVGALVINMAADVASLKVSLAEANRAAATSAEKMATGFGVIKTSIESAITPLKTLGVNVGSLESNMAKAQSSAVSLAKGLLIGAAAGMSIDAIKNKIMGVIDTMAHLKEVSEKTGSSVENLSKLGFIAKQSGSDIDSVATALGKMSKGMAGADNGTKGAGLALKFLGISAKDAAGNLKDPAAMFTEVAKKLDDYKDGAGKAAIAQALFGKAGAEMLPTLKLLAEQGDMVAKVTDAQATAAQRYTRDIVKLDMQKGMLFKTIAMALLPTMTDFTGAMLDATKNTNMLNGAAKGMAADNSIESWADDAAMGLARLIDVIIFIPKALSSLASSFKVVFADIATLEKGFTIISPQKMAAALARGENPFADFKKQLEERNKILEDANAKYSDLWNYNGAAMEQAMAKRIAARVGARNDTTEDAARATPTWDSGKKVLNYNSSGEDGDTKATAALKKEADAYATLTAAIGEKMAAATAEANGLKPLNEAQKLQVALDEQLATGKLKLIPLHKLEYEVKIKALAVELDVIASQKRAAQGAADWAKIDKDHHDAAVKSIEDATKEAEKNEELAKTFGMTKSAIEAMQVARLEEQLAQRSSTGMTMDEIDTLEKLIAAKKRSASATATIEGLEAQKAVWASIDQTAHDTFISIFDSGKSAFDRLRDTLKNGLLDLLYQMTIKKWIFNIGASVGMTGAAGVAQAAGSVAGATSGAGSLISAASNAYSLFSGGMSMAGGLGTGFMGSVSGGLLGAGAGSGLTSSAGLAIGNGIAGVVGPAAAGAISSGMTMVAAAMPWLAAAAIGGAILKFGFGHGERETTSSTLTGSFGADGFSGATNDSWKEKGGWFSSDKTGVTSTGVDAATAKQFGDGYKAMQDASAGFAKAIGVNADSIATRTQAMSIALGKDDAANKQAIADFFTGVGNAIATELVPNLADFSKAGEIASTTLQRLAGDFQATDQFAAMLGKSAAALFGSAGMGSAAARESLLDASGGAAALGQKTSAYMQSFYSEADRIAPVIQAVGAAMDSLGLSSVKTKIDFKAQVDSMLTSGALATAAGAKEFAALMDLAPAFAQAADYTDALTKATIDKAAADQAAADAATAQAAQITADAIAQAQASATASRAAQLAANQSANDTFANGLANSIKNATAAAKALTAFNDSLKLGNLSALSKGAQYDVAKQAYGANPGDQAAATAFLTASQARGGSKLDYARDFAAVIAGNAKQTAMLDSVPSAIIAMFAQSKAWQADGSHAGGLNYVPFDGYKAVLHKGERVQTAAQASSGSGGGMSEATARELIAAINEGNKHSRKTAETLERVTKGGKALQTTAAA